MAKSKTKKRKSQAPVALVYFVTMLIFFGIIGAFALWLLNTYNIIGDDSSSEIETTSPSFSTLYARVNSKGVLADMTYVRVSPEKQTITVVPISAYTVAKDGSSTFREIYEKSGIVKVENAVEKTFEVTIDNYVTVSNESFETVADMFGGISYTPNQELYYLSKDNNDNDISLVEGELVNLSGRQIRLLCQYPVFVEGKAGNTEFLGYAVNQIINSAFQQATITKDNLNNLYNIVTENSDTNLSEDAFVTQKAYLKEMLEANLAPSTALCPKGTWTDDSHFTVSSEFIAELGQAVNDGTVGINDSSDASALNSDDTASAE